MKTRCVIVLLSAALGAAVYARAEERRLPLDEYASKMKAGWIGQMAGVGQGAPTEFRYLQRIIPEGETPAWDPAMINQFSQDDLYVEMTFLRTLELHGLDVTRKQAGIDFANSAYPLWHANRAGRDLLRRGIAPPDSGHPEFNKHADDIDYQIEADFAGLISPGLPNAAIGLGEIFGRLMNYGDGLYGGQFVAGMYAEAFFERDMAKVVAAGLACIPSESQHAKCIRDVVRWHRQYPGDWREAWRQVEAKYQQNPDYRRFSCSDGDFNIDAKINGAYIVIGLLYGGGDLDKTIRLSMRCGQDSDCNPSNAAGILCTALGMEGVPKDHLSALQDGVKFANTAYDFQGLVAVCTKLAQGQVLRAGGRVEEADGGPVFVIPRQTPVPSPLEQCWEPGPVTGSVYTPEEMAQISFEEEPARAAQCASRVDLAETLAVFAPGWEAVDCGCDMAPGLYPELDGDSNILLTHPFSLEVPCVLRTETTVPPAGAALALETSNDPRGDFVVEVRANGKGLLRETVNDGWETFRVDLSAYRGQKVVLEVRNAANGWSWEAARWRRIQIVPNGS